MRWALPLFVEIWLICRTASQHPTPDCITITVDGKREPGEADVIAGRSDWEKSGLDAHNEFRKKHGVPALVINQKLCKSAQWLSNKNANEAGPDKFADVKHTNEFGGAELKCGENLAAYDALQAPIPDPKEIVAAWYGEIADYDFKAHKPKAGAVTTHFTQIVWKDTREVCMAYTESRPGTGYITAHYYPTGNFGKESDNVPSIPDSETNLEDKADKPKDDGNEVASNDETDANGGGKKGNGSRIKVMSRFGISTLACLPLFWLLLISKF